MNLKNLGDRILLENTQSLAQKEREITLEVLRHLREVERRSLFATLSYSSLYEYVVKELKYSEGAAQRRISSMRLLRELPEVEAKVENGELSLSALSQAQSFFGQEKEKITTTQAKREVLKFLENKSHREIEKELVLRSSTPARLIPEKLRQVTETYTELKVLVEGEFLKEVEELKNLLGHRIPGATLKELLAFAVTNTVKSLKPKEPKQAAPKSVEENPKTISPPAPAVKSRYIPAERKKIVWKRDQGQCTFKVNEKRCGCKSGLEFDHVKPFSLGGEHSLNNLRLRCRAHNQLAAIQMFGSNKMSRFVPRLK